MNIYIIGDSGIGKSNMSYLVKNLIFKEDREASITIIDASGTTNTGNGGKEYKIIVKNTITVQELDTCDILINIKTDKFIKRFRELLLSCNKN